MPRKKRSAKDDFENRDPSLLQYVDLVEKEIESPLVIFDDLLMNEEPGR